MWLRNPDRDRGACAPEQETLTFKSLFLVTQGV